MLSTPPAFVLSQDQTLVFNPLILVVPVCTGPQKSKTHFRIDCRSSLSFCIVFKILARSLAGPTPAAFGVPALCRMCRPSRALGYLIMRFGVCQQVFCKFFRENSKFFTTPNVRFQRQKIVRKNPEKRRETAPFRSPVRPFHRKSQYRRAGGGYAMPG